MFANLPSVSPDQRNSRFLDVLSASAPLSEEEFKFIPADSTISNEERFPRFSVSLSVTLTSIRLRLPDKVFIELQRLCGSMCGWFFHSRGEGDRRDVVEGTFLSTSHNIQEYSCIVLKLAGSPQGSWRDPSRVGIKVSSLSALNCVARYLSFFIISTSLLSVNALVCYKVWSARTGEWCAVLGCFKLIIMKFGATPPSRR
ncbi:hypothetical protein ACMFMG_005703 [Clarireedia jacksonii]